MKCIVFAGPSLSVQAGQAILKDAVFLPPLRQADLITAMTCHHPDVIIIVDDYAGQAETVRHSEILQAINSGIKVYGTAANGAVRAFEMDHCGMVGVGSVYQMFKDGVIEDDEEVYSLSHKQKSGDFLRLSEPLVNLRATLAQAVEKQVIEPEILSEIISVIKELPWPERSLEKIFSRIAALAISDSGVDKLRHFVTNNYCDIQKSDTLQTLKMVQALVCEGLCRQFSTEAEARNFNNPFWVLYERDRKVLSEVGKVSLNDLSAHAILDHPHSQELKSSALNREIATFLAGYLGLEVGAEDVARERLRFVAKHGLKGEDDLASWLHDNDLSEDDFALMLQNIALNRVSQKWFLSLKKFRRITNTVLDELRLRGEYVEWKRRACERETNLLGRDDELAALSKTEDLGRTLAQKIVRDGLFWSVEPFEEAEACGFTPATLQLQLLKDKVIRDGLESRAAALFQED